MVATHFNSFFTQSLNPTARSGISIQAALRELVDFMPYYNLPDSYYSVFHFISVNDHLFLSLDVLLIRVPPLCQCCCLLSISGLSVSLISQSCRLF